SIDFLVAQEPKSGDEDAAVLEMEGDAVYFPGRSGTIIGSLESKATHFESETISGFLPSLIRVVRRSVGRRAARLNNVSSSEAKSDTATEGEVLSPARHLHPAQVFDDQA